MSGYLDALGRVIDEVVEPQARAVDEEGRWPARSWFPASSRSGKFCVMSSPGTTACPSRAGMPKTTAGSRASSKTGITSPRGSQDPRIRATADDPAGRVSNDGSVLITRMTADESEKRMKISAERGSRYG
jgi:hypothetical protein